MIGTNNLNDVLASEVPYLRLCIIAQHRFQKKLDLSDSYHNIQT